MYARELEKSGIKVILKESKGFEDNSQQIEDPKNSTQVAFVISGVGDSPESRTKSISSLGSIQYAPLWLFYKGDNAPFDDAEWLSNKRIYIGDNGTATKSIATQILTLNGLIDKVKTISIPYNQLKEAVDNNAIDVIFLLDQENSEGVQYLVNRPDWHLSPAMRYKALKKPFPTYTFLKYQKEV